MQTNIKNLPVDREYFTEIGYSQSYPYVVVKRTANSVTLRPIGTTADPEWKPEMLPGGFCAHCTNQHAQTWLYAGDLEGIDVVVRKTKLGWSRHGVKFVENRATYFYDYNF